MLLAVAGFVVVSSSIESDPSARPDPALIRPQYYVADLPRGFSMYLAEARGEGGVDPAEFADNGQAELWATPDATATTGSWFVVSQGDQHATGRNSYRLIVDGMEVVFEHDPASGQTRLSFTKDGNPMAITSFGWIDRQLVRLVRSVNIDNSEIRFTDGFFTSDHQRVLQADPATAMFGLPAARVGYATGLPAELAENFTITVAGDDVHDLARVRSFALTKPRQFNVGTLPGIVGQLAADPSITVAQWHDGDRLISMQGNFDADRLEAFAQSVHSSPAAQVKSQLEAGAPPAVAALRAKPDTVVSGMLSDGWGWAIQVSRRSPEDTGQGYLWWIGQPGDTSTPSETRPSAAGDTPMIDTFVEHGRTYVLARIPRSMDGAELHVAPTGLRLDRHPSLRHRSGAPRRVRGHGVHPACSVHGPDHRCQRDDRCVLADLRTDGVLGRTEQFDADAPGELHDDVHREADDVADAALDARHQYCAGALQRVGAGLVHRLAGRHVPIDRRLVEYDERDQRRARLDQLHAVSAHGDTGVHAVGTPGQSTKHRRCLVRRRSACRGSAESRSTVVSAAMTSSSGCSGDRRRLRRRPAGVT